MRHAQDCRHPKARRRKEQNLRNIMSVTEHKAEGSEWSECNKMEDSDDRMDIEGDASKELIDLTRSPRKHILDEGNTLKKLTIKNFRKTSLESQEKYYNDVLEKLDMALMSIFERKKIVWSLQELYKGVENLCRAFNHLNNEDPWAIKCYRILETRSKESIKLLLSSILKKISSFIQTEGDIVKIVIEKGWEIWIEQISTIRNIFFYFDRTFLLITPGLSSIWDTGISLFREYLFMDISVKEPFFFDLFSIIASIRSCSLDFKKAPNILLLQSSIKMINSLNLYTSLFEPKFIRATEIYYNNKALELVEKSYPEEYLSHIKEILSKEENFCKEFFSEQTKSKVIHVIEIQMIENHSEYIINTGFEKMMVEGNTKSLKDLYTLLKLVNKVELIKVHLAEYIKKTCKNSISNSKDNSNIIPSLLNFHSTLNSIISECFLSNESFIQTFRECFEFFINNSINNSAEMLAKHIDNILRSGNKSFDEESLGNEMDRTLELFRFIQGKDIFEAFYKRDLAKRLLLNKISSTDAEKAMLLKLKTECGSGFTQKLEGMFKDIDISKNFMAFYKNSKSTQNNPPVSNLYVNILSQAFWPSYPNISIILPEKMKRDLNSFSSFYFSKEKDKKLTWRHNLGHCVVKADFPKGKKELNVTLFQAVVILLFNNVPDNSTLSYSEIKKSTGLEDKELIRTLQSLACGKVRVLLKSSKGKDINTTDLFLINLAFSEKLFKIKINQIQLKETSKENKIIHENIQKDRSFEIQATIVRIMKAKKKSRHTELVQAIETAIEKLLEKEYIEKDEKNPDTYIYLA
ncbi:hypothetical protein MERGE_001034 [Pneumocystis wakefieldiae]|uniref:Cullin family profile domain-containing protein n=1 Tax=Pneumocystis wakefieldiae TaxID=38082 RepID=A0A899FXY4_9ASCO|nr:hypothetical protein MERGE_001034 [Pneumocystis wakefieldiae]